jgi:hypothetical protein
MHPLTDQAFAVYKLTKDPLVLSAISLLETPTHPHYQEVTEFLTELVKCYTTLFGHPPT